MAFVNENYCNLKESFLFADIAHKVSAYAEAHPDKRLSAWVLVTLPCRWQNVLLMQWRKL